VPGDACLAEANVTTPDARSAMRPVTLFTGQWADLPLDRLAGFAGGAGFDGLELACWGDHFEVDKALADDQYCRERRELLARHGLNCWALGAHLVGQAVSDPIDERHRGILPPEIWGDGDPEGVRARAAERMKDTARAAARFGVTQVNGFTGSPIWQLLYSFPPNDFEAIQRGYEQVAESWAPIMDVFDQEGVRFGLEVHPTEIAYDFVTTRKTLDALDNRVAFGINLDPSHFAHQFLDAAQFALEFADRIYHVHVKDSKRRLDGRRSILASHLSFGEEARGWDFVSPGHGDVDFESFFRALNRIGYNGPLSIEWEDSGMDREYGARDAVAFVRDTDFAPSSVAFDAAMQREQA
jgi:sugar phosphate isomerase/epimerase